MKQMAQWWQPLHKVILIYSLATFLILLFTPFTPNDIKQMFWPRLLVIGYLGLLPFVRKIGRTLADVSDLIWALALLGFFYKETAILNQTFYMWDVLFIQADHWLTGTQPSLVFSSVLSSRWIADVFYLGYFSYYFMTVGVSLIFYRRCQDRYKQLFFIIITSFLLYYLLFALFKTVGPQFYFPAPNNQPPPGVFFAKAMHFIQKIGEVPTGAFPSSHVGMTMVFLWLSFKHYRPMYWVLLPFAMLLIPATVYIKAHYLVDVLAGIISGFILLYLSTLIWNLLSKANPSIHDTNH
ncbi:MAG: phosphatase PAP2 family protein [Breznakibacter sp.]